MKTDNLKIKLKEKIRLLPELSGVYHFFDKYDNIIYIGKAKNLRKRVLSYFTKNHEHYKTSVLVKKICNVKYSIVKTEIDALLLENNLIKKYRPRYNILLKDDKSYPWICIKKEAFPRVFRTRKIVKDGSKYYGPYTSISIVRNLNSLFKELFQLRTCNHNLTKENINKNKYKVCLEYHIKNCKAPCVNKQTEKEYQVQIDSIHDILNGNFKRIKKYLRAQMFSFSAKMEYEKANEIKKRIELLQNYQSRSTIVNPKIGNIDIFSIISKENNAYINSLKVANGAIISINNIEIKKKLDETDKELLPMAITEIRHSKLSGFVNADEIIVPFEIEYPEKKIKITIPKIGDKKKLLELSERNAKYYKLELQKQRSLIDPERHTKRILETMKKDLRMTELPVYIECFDNSNIQGTTPIAACIVFRNTKPYKKDYRKFNIKTVHGPDDFASMEEVIYRRYKRLIDENKKLPQLIIIDGGKGQLNAALKSLDKLEIKNKIAIIGIAKRLEEIYFPGDKIPLYLDKNSETLKIIQKARNEAHRFGITFHRNKRSKKFIKTELKNIKGVGEATIKKLMLQFKTVKNISNKTEEELEKSVGKSKSKLIYRYFEDK